VLLPAVAAGPPGRVLAVLMGVSIGPNLSYAGSLATLLWRRLLRQRGHEPGLGEFTRLGLLTRPRRAVPGHRGPVGCLRSRAASTPGCASCTRATRRTGRGYGAGAQFASHVQPARGPVRRMSHAAQRAGRAQHDSRHSLPAASLPSPWIARARCVAAAMTSHPGKARVHYIEVLAVADDSGAHRRMTGAQLMDVFLEQSARLSRTGNIPVRDLSITSVALLGATRYAMTGWLPAASPPPLDTVVETLVQLFAAGLTRPAP
jgi:hypothetical protein